MTLLQVCSVALLVCSVAQASIDNAPSVGLDKDNEAFRRFMLVPIVRPVEPQQQDIDYYDAVERGLDSDEPRTPEKGSFVSGPRAESVVSAPDYETLSNSKISQKEVDTKRGLNANAFSVRIPEDQINTDPASIDVVDDEISSGQEPAISVVDGETGPPSIEPSSQDMFKPPVASQFPQVN